MALEPITRQEKIIAGQDLTPITRMEKFLKEFGGSGGGVSSWNDLTDKPFGEKENVIFPETTVTFTPMEEEGGMFFVFMTAFPTAFKPFEYYTVNYNGVDYTCKSSENGMVGNGLVDGGEDTGEPFAMASHEGMLTVISLTGETSATMSIRYHATDKIELKYIPEPDMLDLVSLGLPTVHACYKENGAVISDAVSVSINYEQFKEIEKKLLTGSIWAKIKVSCKYGEDAFGNGGQGLKEVECETLFRVCEKIRSSEYDKGLMYHLYAIVGSIFFIKLTINSSNIFAKMYRLNILPEDRS